MSLFDALPGENALLRGRVERHGPAKDFIGLFSLDDPEQWIPPNGPLVAPPSHIETIIRKRKLWNERDDAIRSVPPPVAPPFQNRRLQQQDSELNLRKDFFKLRHPKNLHHAGKFYTLPRQYGAEQYEGGAKPFLREENAGWFMLKRVFNPDVFECMANYIVPLENYEFYAAFEVLLSCLHNSQLIMRLTSKGKRFIPPVDRLID